MKRKINRFIFIMSFLLVTVLQAQQHENADIFYYKAENLIIAKQYSQAIEFFEKVIQLELQKDQPQLDLLGLTWDNIGLCYSNLENHEKALEFHLKALNVSKELANDENIAASLNSIGMDYEYLQRYKLAYEYYLRSLKIIERLNHNKERYNIIENIGRVCYHWGKYDEAIQYYKKNLTIAERLKEDKRIAKSLSSIGDVYLSWCKYDEAIKYYKRAYAIASEYLIFSDMADYLYNIGVAYFSLEKYTKALEHFEASLAINRDSNNEMYIAATLKNIAYIYFKQKSADKALEFINESIETFAKLNANKSIQEILGTLYWINKDYNKAIRCFISGLEECYRDSDKPGSLIFLFSIGSIYKKLHNYNGAIIFFDEAIEILEELRKTAPGRIRIDFLHNQIKFYQELASVYVQNKKHINSLFKTLEISRAKYLVEKLTLTDSNIFNISLDKVLGEINKNEAIIYYSNFELENQIELAISNKANNAFEICGDDHINSAFKEYLNDSIEKIDNQRGFNKIINDSFFLFDMAKDKNNRMTKLVKHYRNLLVSSSSKNNFALIELSRLFYSLLIKPHHEYIKDKKELIIIPDGILAFIPFETLIDENGKYLVEKYNIKYAHSLGVHELIKKRNYNKNRKPMLAFGGAVYDEISYKLDTIENERQFAYFEKNVLETLKDRGSIREAYGALDNAHWQNLPGTLIEVHNIQAIIANANVITGNQVTENNVKKLSESGELANYKVLHFATHGLTVPELPELSALVLSQFKEERNGEDGYLRMGEIAELNIQADFVNLSACETGLGKIYGGEGVVGLTQSFLIAGANAMSVSLWNVADESTSKFMTAMYKLVEEKGMDYAEAMAEVKRQFIRGDFGEKYKSPFYWGPFVYYGK